MSTVEQRVKAMQLAHEVMDKEGLRHWLFNGAALGIYRDGDLIPWDDDVDFCCRDEDLMPRFAAIVAALYRCGFRVIAKESQSKMSAFLDGAKVAISGYWLDTRRTFRRRRRFYIPAKFFECDGEVSNRGVTYRTLAPIEEYLEWTYKNWRVPNNSADEKDYNRAKFLGH